MDIGTFYKRSRLSDSQKSAIITALKENPLASMRSVHLSTGVPLGSVRLAYGYLGVDPKANAKAVQDAKDDVYVEKIRGMAEAGSSAREIGEEIGMAGHAVSRLMKRHGIKRVLAERHGTANQYNRGCRCEPCKAENARRHREGAVSRIARPDEVPHGTESGYVNWYCRCEPCSAIGRAKLRERQAVRGDGARVGERWTEGEVKTIVDYESPAREHAVGLGRTLGSVYGARKYRGINNKSRPRVRVK